MSDSRILDLERRVREGDPSARVLLSFERVRIRTGYLICWDRSVEGACVFWVTRTDRYGRTAKGIKGGNVPKVGKKRVQGVIRAVAVLDLEDFMATAQRHPGHCSTLLDLASGAYVSGCYPRKEALETISATPPKGARAKAGVQEETGRNRARREAAETQAAIDEMS